MGCSFDIGVEASAIVDASGATDARDPNDADLTPQTRTFREGLAGYAGTLDSYLSNNVPGPHGAETVVIWDLIPDEEHALVQFTGVFGAGPTQIPPGATIVSASLRLVIVDPTASIGTIREVAVPWDEQTTWVTFGGAAGVQASDVGTTVGASPASGASTIDVTASLSTWSANPRASFGWLVSPGGSDGCDAASSEASNEDDRPTLVVTYVAASRARGPR